jgi:hypothetical protein
MRTRDLKADRGPLLWVERACIARVPSRAGLGTGLSKRWIDSFGSSICLSHHLDRAISAGVPVTMIPVICALIGAAFGVLIGYGFGWARAMRETEAMLAHKSGPVV